MTLARAVSLYSERFSLPNGRIPVTPLVTGTVGIDGVAGAFEELASPERHAKILVHP